MSGLKRKYGVRQHGADPIRTEAVQRICQLMGSDPLAVRDRALLLIGYAGGFRRSALVSLDVGDVQFVDQGVILRLARDKGDQEGDGRLVGIHAGTNIETCPVLALRAWWRVAGHHHATRATPLFTAIDRWGVIDITGDRLSDKAVNRAIKRWARHIGLVGAYSAHSLRAGHVTEARDRGGRNVRAQQQLGHASADTTDRYDRAEIWERNSWGFLGL
jgi:integrase